MSALSAILGQQFTYAHGRIGVLKQLMLTQSDVDRLLGSHDRKEAEAILTELKLTSQIDQGLSTWQEILAASEAWVYQEVTQMSPVASRPVFLILWLSNLAPLLSYLLKKHHDLTSSISQEPVPGLCPYNRDAIQSLVEDDIASTLPSHFVQFVRTIKALENVKAFHIDTYVHQYIVDTQLSLARSSGSRHIHRYVQHSVDVSNIKTALRHLGEQTCSQELDFFLLKGGALSLHSSYDSVASIANAVMSTPSLPFSLADAIRNADNDYNALEQAFSEVLAEDIAHMWNVPLTIEPLFAFAAIAMSNLTLLRSILIGKLNDLSPQEIKQISPPFIPATHYVLS